MSNEQKLREALRIAVNYIDMDALYTFAGGDHDTIKEALATTEPEPTGLPELHPVAHIELGDDSHDVVTLEAAKAYAAAVVQQYKEDAERYRWLADCNNYYEAINLISDGSLTEDALGKAIDAAMAKGLKG